VQSFKREFEMKFIKRMFILLIGVLVLCTNINAYNYLKMDDGSYVFQGVDFTDKDFNIYLALFGAVVSDAVYDDDFNMTSSRNYLLYNHNGFYFQTITKKSGILDIEATIGKKEINGKTLIVVSFRGTNFGKKDGVDDILTDLYVEPTDKFSLIDKKIKVHSGFFN